VIAFETLEASAEAARLLARELGPHVTVVHGDISQGKLTRRADMCIAELVGSIGGAEGIGVVLERTRQHLESDAVVVPHRVKTLIAGLAAGDLLGAEPRLHPIAANYCEAVMRSAGALFDLRISMGGIETSDLLTTRGILEDLNLTTGRHDEPSETTLRVVRAGKMDSYLAWINLQCAPGQPFLDSLAIETNWMPVLIPFCSETPVDVQPGDVCTIRVSKRLVDGVHPEWFLAGTIRGGNGKTKQVRATSPYAGGEFRASWLHRALFTAIPDM
jgi:protein arginine N-methyltransferase 1